MDGCVCKIIRIISEELNNIREILVIPFCHGNRFFLAVADTFNRDHFRKGDIGTESAADEAEIEIRITRQWREDEFVIEIDHVARNIAKKREDCKKRISVYWNSFKYRGCNDHKKGDLSKFAGTWTESDEREFKRNISVFSHIDKGLWKYGKDRI